MEQNLEIQKFLPPLKRKPSIVGKLKGVVYHEPQKWWREGVRYRLKGFLARKWVEGIIQKERLETPFVASPSDLRVAYLIGRKYLYLGIISAYSLRQNVDKSCMIDFFDDGSLDADAITVLCNAVPGARIVSFDEWSNDSVIRDHRGFKALHLLPGRYPHIMKILLHSHLRKYSIISDCDVLFLSKCSELLKLARAQVPFFLVDKKEHYGLSRLQISELCSEAPSRVNAGFYALHSERIDFEKLDALCFSILERYGFSYVLEQFLTATVLSSQASRALPPTYAMAAYENQEYGAPNMLHYANVVPAMFIDAQRRIKTDGRHSSID